MANCICCTIAPPYLLERLSIHTNEAERQAARRTLEATAVFGSERAVRGAAPAALPSLVAARQQGLSGARATYSAQGRQKLPGKLMREERQDVSNDPAVNEAHENAGITRDFLRKVFKWNSVDGRGMPLVSTVHYGKDYDNAFWDGSQMVYGDGDGALFGRFTKPLEVVAHELAHGVVQYTSQLIYFEQPGALNEHFADVMGSLVKQWHLEQEAERADWLIGADLFLPDVKAKALRSMKKPGSAFNDPMLGKDRQVSHMEDLVVSMEDNGGVHINSGIPNLAFYKVAMGIGGYAWEEAGDIWWRAFRDLGPRASFRDAADETLKVALERHGRGAQKVVRDAWSEVGVLPAAAARTVRAVRPKTTGRPTSNGPKRRRTNNP